MKHKLVIILLPLYCCFFSFSQDVKIDSVKNEQKISKLYILDETWDSNSPKRFKMDNLPNYIQIEGNQGVLISRSRSTCSFLEGEIDGLKVTTENGMNIIRFFIRGRSRSIGKIASFEIYEKQDNNYEIHYYNKLGDWDVYYSSHEASPEEKKKIIQYWKGDHE